MAVIGGDLMSMVQCCGGESPGLKIVTSSCSIIVFVPDAAVFGPQLKEAVNRLKEEGQKNWHEQ